MSKDKKIERIDKLCNYVYKKFIFHSRRHIKRIRVKLSKNKISEEKKKTHLFSILFLNKNLGTSKIIKTLISKGQFDEALILMRVMLERSALVYRVLEGGLSTKDIDKLRAPNCIKYLKHHFDMGKLYGLMSDIIHSKPYPSILFAITNLEKNKSKTIDNFGLLFKIYSIYFMEINFAVIEFLAKDYFKIKSEWRLNDKFWTYLPLGKTGIYNNLIGFYEMAELHK